jgi:hypothetical protein
MKGWRPVDVFWLVVLWLALGLLAGLLANGARLGLAAQGLGGRFAMQGTLALGMGGALVGGILGWLLLGRFFAVPTALWVSVAAVAVGPWLWRVAPNAWRNSGRGAAKSKSASDSVTTSE